MKRRQRCTEHDFECDVENVRCLVAHGWTGYSFCPECRNKHWHLATRDRLGEAKIPLRYQAKGFDDFQVENDRQKRALEEARDYASDFDQHLAAGRCLLFVGGVGTGKTHLACGIMAALVSKGKRVQYYTVSEIIRALRDTWKREAKIDETALLDCYAKLDLLVVDELGVQFGTLAEQTQFSELLDRRYRNLRPTLLISNLDLPNLKNLIGERVLDRLRENGGKIVPFDWTSHRSHAAQPMSGTTAANAQRGRSGRERRGAYDRGVGAGDSTSPGTKADAGYEVEEPL